MTGVQTCALPIYSKQIYNLITEKKSFLSTEVFNSITECFAKSNEIEMALSVTNEMKKYEIPRDTTTYSILLNIHSNAINEEKCILIYEETMRMNVKPSLDIFSALLNLFIKKKKILQAIGIYTDIKMNKIECTEGVYSQIINACLSHLKIESALEIVYDAYTSKVKLQLEVYKNILDCLVNLRIRQIEKMNYTKMIVNILREEGGLDQEVLEKLNKIN